MGLKYTFQGARKWTKPELNHSDWMESMYNQSIHLQILYNYRGEIRFVYFRVPVSVSLCRCFPGMSGKIH